MRTSTVLSLTGAALVSGFVGYAAYFDYKRRNDPAFRSRLKKDQKRTSKEIKKRNEQRKKQANEVIQRTVDELNKPGALPTSVGEKEEVFMQSVQEGELLLAQGPELYVAAAAAFYRGMKVYPQPMELLTIYKKAVPEEALNYIFEMLSKDPSMIAGRGGMTDPVAAALAQATSGAQLEEIDDESPNDVTTTPSINNPTASTTSETDSSPSAPLSSQGAESSTGSINNGDNSSQEWEKVGQEEEEEKKEEEVVGATDEHLAQVAQEALAKEQ